jgi:hypothetical protein
LRTIVGLILGIALFLVGVPALQSVVRRVGYYDPFTYEQAVLGMLLVIGCVIAAQLTALKPPADRD